MPGFLLYAPFGGNGEKGKESGGTNWKFTCSTKLIEREGMTSRVNALLYIDEILNP
jgi:hypothetical protein